MEEVRASSACTGAYTAELALGVVEKTINDSAFLSRRVSFVPKSSHDSSTLPWSIFVDLIHTHNLSIRGY